MKSNSARDLRVCVVADNLLKPNAAGAEQSTLAICEELARVGVELSLVTAGTPCETPSQARRYFAQVRSVSSKPAGRAADFLLMARPVVAAEVAREVCSIGPDLVQTHIIQNFTSYLLFGELRRAGFVGRIVATIHDHSSLCRGGLRCKGEALAQITDRDYQLPSLAECWVCQKHTFNPLKRSYVIDSLNRFCDAVVFVSDAVRSFYVANGLTTKTQVIYNGIRYSECLGDRQEDPVPSVIAGGRMRSTKGYHRLIEVWNEVSRRVGKRPRLVLYGGDNEYSRDLRALASRNGLEGQVEIRGWLGDAERADLFLRGWVGAVPSMGAEALPRSVLEYMNAGLPTVASSVGGTPEAIRNGETGFLMNPWKDDEVIDPIVRLLTDDSLRARIGEAGSSAAKQNFDIRNTVAKRLDFYASLL